MNMTNRETHTHEADSLESRLHRYGNTLDASVGVTSSASDDMYFGSALKRSTRTAGEALDFQHLGRPTRKARLFAGAAMAAISALAISTVSLGGPSTTTIVTADSPPLKKVAFPAHKKVTPSAVIVDVQGISVSSAIAPRLKSLLDAAKADGFTNISGSGYRSSVAQIVLRKAHCGSTAYDLYVKPSSQCNPPTSRPGYSDHERGVAIDFSQNGQILKAEAPFVGWLSKHADEYGFSGIPDEPWHWSTSPVSPVLAKAEVGSTIGTLEIETAKVSVPLLEGAGFEQLRKGAGREHLSSPLGESGEAVIHCQRTTYGAPCFDLDLLKPTEKIIVRTNGARYEYTVNKVFIIDNILTANRLNTPAVEVPVSLRGHSILTLLAHHPRYSARQSLVVRAELSGVEFGDSMYLDAGTFK